MEHQETKPTNTDGKQVLQLVVDTPVGLGVRTVPAALSLPPDVDQGTGAELATHRAAAMWGLPDFVYRSAIRKVASGQRELGDRLLLVGGRGASVQIKSREGAYKDDAGEQSWLQSRGRKAARQAKGTVRNLRTQAADLVNGRGRTITVHGGDYEWLVVVVLDHDHVPTDVIVDCELTGIPSVVLIRRDWEFLFDQLRSATAVLDYLFRVAELPPVPLGEEPVRYYELAAEDLAATPGEVNPAVLALGGDHLSAPLLPQAPVGSGANQAHLVTRMILEDIATSTMKEGMTEKNRLTLLSEVDASLPVSLREEWGRLLLDMLGDVHNAPNGGIKWRWRRVIKPTGTRQLVLGCATRHDPYVQTAFMSYVLLRHHEVTQATGLPEESVTLAVLLTPLLQDTRPWDTQAMRIEGVSRLTAEEIENYTKLWSV